MNEQVTVSGDLISSLRAVADDPADIRTEYSGRSMYGRTCLAYTGEDLAVFVFRLAVAILETENDDSEAPDLYDVENQMIIIGDPRTDMMGRSMIYYWPNVTVGSDEN